MTCWWTRLGISLTLLGTLIQGVNCSARAQEPEPSVRREKSTDESSSSTRSAEQIESSVQPARDWEDRENSVGLHLLKNIAEDQKAVWIGAKSVRFADADWLVPVGGAAAAMFVTD